MGKGYLDQYGRFAIQTSNNEGVRLIGSKNETLHDWQTRVNTTSGNCNSVHTTVNTNSGNWPYSTAISALGVVANNPTGYVNRTNNVIGFDDTTRTITISPVAAFFDYYLKGIKHTITTAQTAQIPNVEGSHYIYFDKNENLNSTLIFDSNFLFIEQVITSIIYWSVASASAIYFADERHGISMDGSTHALWHETLGARWIEGLGFFDISPDETTGGAGDQDWHSIFSYTSGQIADEDLRFTWGQSLSAQIPVYYKTGASSNWLRDDPRIAPVKNFVGGAGRLAYNQFTVGAWQQTEVSNLNYVLSHIFATNDSNNPIIAIQGENEYTNKNKAREGANVELKSLFLGNMPFAEFVPLGTIIYQTYTGYTNTVKARIISTDEGYDYIDWRLSELGTSAGVVNDHGTLGGLADDDHLQYIHKDGRRAFTGNIDMSSNNINHINTLSATTISGGNIYAGEGGNCIKINSLGITYKGTARPKKTIILTAKDGWPSTTSGCDVGTQQEYATNEVDTYHLAFSKISAEFAQWNVVMPDTWDGGTINARFYWTTDTFAGGTSGIKWSLQGRSYGDSDAIDQAWGTKQIVYDQAITADDIHITSATPLITLAGTPSGGEMIQFRACRESYDAADTLNDDAKLLNIKVRYTSR